MKKVFFAVLSSLMGTSIVQAYTLYFTNLSRQAANFEVRYARETSFSCRKDTFTLQSGEKKDIGTGACCWNKVRCTGAFGTKEVAATNTCQDCTFRLQNEDNLDANNKGVYFFYGDMYGGIPS